MGRNNDRKPAEKSAEKSKPETLTVEVKSTSIETRTGIKAKRGDVITIPADERSQTGSIRHALRTGGLKVIEGTTDLQPVASEPAKSPEKTPEDNGDVHHLDETQE